MSENNRRTLDRILSQAGICSRTQAREAVRAGRVAVDGLTVHDVEAWFDPETSAVTLDGKPIGTTKRLYIAFHKPAGYVTTRDDPEGRPTVYDLLKDVGEWVAPVGRLDLETSGLLLLTNDSAWSTRVLSPKSKIPKTYRVKAKGGLTEEKIRALREGVELPDGKTLPAQVTVQSATAKRTLLEITITEGRNRQVRRMLKAVGSKVLELERVAIGNLRLEGLEPGRWRILKEQEAASLAATSLPA